MIYNLLKAFFMKKLCLKVILFIIFYFIGQKVIKDFGILYSDTVDGFQHGNRLRFISILQLQWFMLFLDFINYVHLFSYFNSSGNIYEFDRIRESKNTTSKNFRFYWFCIFFTSLIFTHSANLLYLIQSFNVPWFFNYVCQCFQGVWLHLYAFSFFFVVLNFVQKTLFNQSDKIKNFFENYIFNRFILINKLCCEKKFQVKVTLSLTIFFCFLHWYFSDKIFVKHFSISLKIKNNISTQPYKKNELKIAVLTDLHAGACVYEKQILNVVDKVNELNADVVVIIGDAIDASVSLIKKRVYSLKYLRSKYGTFFVTGNHEYYYGNADDWISLFDSYGIITLRNKHIILNDICIVGLDDISSGNSGIKGHQMNVSAIRECASNMPIVILEHNPLGTKEIMEYSNKHNCFVNLILSGHTHAGQYYILVPYVIFTLPYFYGEYEIQSQFFYEKTKLFVSAGTLYQGAPMKMPFMSEIWLFTLTT